MGWAYKVTVPPYEGVPNPWIEQEMEWRDALAMDPNNTVLGLVAYAWAGFGAAFGPVLLIGLYWSSVLSYIDPAVQSMLKAMGA